MSTEVEELYVALTGDVEKFRDALVEAGVISEDFGDKVEKAGEKTDEMGKKSEDAGLSLTDLKSGLDLAMQGVELLQKGYEATIGMTLDMIDNTRLLANTIGATPEEASKLIAVADDIGIEFGKLQAAMTAAVRQGYEPTIENLGRMSDMYNSIQDPMEQSEYLLERFGKGAASMAELMKLGSESIREMGEAAEDTNQVFSEEDLANAKAFEMAWDNLADTAKASAISFSTAVLPALTSGLDGITAALGGFTMYVEAVTGKIAESLGLGEQGAGAMMYDKPAMDDAVAEWQAAQQAMRDEAAYTARITMDASEQYSTYAMMAYDAAQSTDIFSESQALYQDAMERSAQANERFDGTLFDSNLTLDETFGLIDMGIGNTIIRWKEYIEWMQSGGLDLQTAVEHIKLQLDEEAITPDEAQEFFNELFVKAQVLDENLGKITADDAAKNIAETLGTSLEDAYQIFLDMKADIEAGVKGYGNIDISVNVSYADQGGGGDDNTGGGSSSGSGSGNGGYRPPKEYEQQAEGGDYWLTEPTYFVAGEKTAERAIFIPEGKSFSDVASAPLDAGSRGGGGDTYIINDRMAAAMYLEQKRRERIGEMEARM